MSSSHSHDDTMNKNSGTSVKKTELFDSTETPISGPNSQKIVNIIRIEETPSPDLNGKFLKSQHKHKSCNKKNPSRQHKHHKHRKQHLVTPAKKVDD